jgi:hypothetical protein
MSHKAEEIGSNTTIISFPWPKHEPLPDGIPAVMPFEYKLLPEKLRPYVENCAHSLQAPPDFVAAAMIVGLASLIGRKITIRPKQNETWTVKPNLWGAIIGLPSSKKTPAQNKATQPIYDLDTEAWDKFQGEQKANAATTHQQKAEISALKYNLAGHYKGQKNLKDVDPETTSTRIAELEEEVEQILPRRYFTNDVTIEKLAELLTENIIGMLLLRDEIIGWLRTMERDGHEGDRAFYLEAWEGDGSAYHDRIGRGTTRCEALCLSIIGGIQPGPLMAYVSDALSDGVRADGLLQRFQVMVWPDPLQKWEYTDELINPDAYQLAFSAFKHLNDITPERVGATIPENGLPYLHFDDEAQEIFVAWSTELNTVKIPNAEHPAIQSHLAKYESLMPSLALILHLADGHTGPVSAQIAAKAADCDYLESHARRVYAACMHRDIHAAHRLVKKIEAGKIFHEMKVRDIYHKQWAGLDRPATTEALAVLEDYGWLRVDEVKPESGGRPSKIVLLHPELREIDDG